MDLVPIAVPWAIPVKIHTHGPWVRILAGMDIDNPKSIHRLPVSNTTGPEKLPEYTISPSIRPSIH